jgi:hypothetical protein
VIDPHRVAADVSAAVRATLLQRFGFDARELGQSVSATEVMAAAQRVAGVVAVNLRWLDVNDGTGRHAVLVAHRARLEGHNVLPAELLTIGTIDLGEST